MGDGDRWQADRDVGNPPVRALRRPSDQPRAVPRQGGLRPQLSRDHRLPHLAPDGERRRLRLRGGDAQVRRQADSADPLDPSAREPASDAQRPDRRLPPDRSPRSGRLRQNPVMSLIPWREQAPRRGKILVVVVAYEAERHVVDTFERIPDAVLRDPEVDFVCLDDASTDAGADRLARWAAERELDNLSVLHNPINQGYGGNQKLGYRLAVDRGYEFVILLHGDGQYAPELLDL